MIRQPMRPSPENRFKVSDVRAMGRTAAGVKGLRLKYKSDEVVSLAIIPAAGGEVVDDYAGEETMVEDEGEVEETGEGPILLTITENGFGKRAYAQKYRLTRRGSGGVINIHSDQIGETGKVVKLMLERPESEILLVSKSGMVIRTTASCIRLVNRVAKGVIVMRLNEGDQVQAVALIDNIPDEDESGECSANDEE